MDVKADEPSQASIENAASRPATGQRTPMSKKRRLVTPSGGSPDDKGSDDDAQPKLKASAATAKGTGRNARTKGKAKGKANGKAKGKAKAKEKLVPAGGVTLARDRPIGPPFRLKYKTWRQNFRLELYGRVSNRYILHITSLNFKTSPNFRAIMQTILEEVKAGALTTKGQVISRRKELIEIERAGEAGFAEATARGEPSSGGTAATAEHRAAGEFFGEDVESRHPLDCST